eukprot:16427891-Heterocapsa_arctica.AAC.1
MPPGSGPPIPNPKWVGARIGTKQFLNVYFSRQNSSTRDCFQCVESVAMPPVLRAQIKCDAITLITSQGTTREVPVLTMVCTCLMDNL